MRNFFSEERRKPPTDPNNSPPNFYVPSGEGVCYHERALSLHEEMRQEQKDKEDLDEMLLDAIMISARSNDDNK